MLNIMCVCVCILALVNDMQIEYFHHRVILPHVAFLSLPYFPTLPKKTVRFSGKNLLNVKHVFRFPQQLLSGTFLIL